MHADDLGQFHALFFDEADDHARVLEERLLELESRPTDLELLNALFRAAHSIKGSSGALGFEALLHLTHAMEHVLDALRGQRIGATTALTTTLLSATDVLKACIAAARAKTPSPSLDTTLAALSALVPGAAPVPGVDRGDHPAAPGEGPVREWNIVFRPHPEVFQFGIDPALVLRELEALGTLEVEAVLDQLPPLESLDAERCLMGWRLTLCTTAGERQVRDAFVFVEDVCELSLSPAAPPDPASPVAVADEPEAPPPPGPAAHPEASTLRVATEKVDRLVNLVGELVIAQAMASRTLATFTEKDLDRLRESFGEMERFTKELQDRVMNIRMVPIGSTFGRFRRLVRDLAPQLGKEIILATVGEDTELDKSMVEALVDPLTHLVRNCADHGVEPPAQREAAGKAAAGTIELSARHQGGNVVIEVSDDGKGLDVARIRRRAEERGLIEAGAPLSDEELHELIFAPGFSTAAHITDVSGRGVGMDVVKRSVGALKGTIALFSTPGKGSRFRLTLPLTLAILDGMAVRVGSSTFVVPLNQVTETLSFTPRSVSKLMRSGEVLTVRGTSTPLVALSRLLGVAEDGVKNPRPLAVVCQAQEQSFAIKVDELIGKGQFVIKSLEDNFRRLDGVLGATILGDGSISYILDVQALAGQVYPRAQGALR